MVCASFTVGGGGGGGGTMQINGFSIDNQPNAAGKYVMHIQGTGTGSFHVTVNGVTVETRSGTFTGDEIVYLTLTTGTHQICVTAP